MPTVDRASPLPLWAQIADELRRRVAEGEFEQRFPTEEELSHAYGVSRQTVREAVRHLQTDGLLVRQRGRGTHLARPVLEQPLHALYSLASTVRAQGLPERSQVRARGRRRAPAGVRAALRLPAGDDVLYLERLRFAGADPIALDRSWLPWSLGANLMAADLDTGGLYEALAQYCGVRITGGQERIQPVVLDAASRRLLDVGAHTAAFAIERLARTGDDPVEWRHSLIRGDRYCLVAGWPSGSGTPNAPREPARAAWG